MQRKVRLSGRGLGPRRAASLSLSLLMGAVVSAQAQNFEPPAITPLGAVGVPDVNAMGLLDKTGVGADIWSFEPITKVGQQEALQQLGKALYWDMQVGSDGVQACASCHFHAGADNRIQNQVSPHGPKAVFNRDFDLLSVNQALNQGDFNDPNNTGLPADEGLVTAAGSEPDDLLTGIPGAQGLGDPSGVGDTNDVLGSQGVTKGTFEGLSGAAVELHSGGTGLRQVTERNTPSAINAVYNLRNFWDGRAEAFFNGVNPHGFQDQDAAVRVWNGASLDSEKLRIPFSSLASQAVGPIGSEVEMIFAGRPARDLGKKMLDPALTPLNGQRVACDDSLLGELTSACDGGFQRGLDGVSYAQLIDDIFDDRFTGGDDTCLNAQGDSTDCTVEIVDATVCGVGADGNALACEVRSDEAYTLKEYNFALFFGLAVQAYEATLITPDTIVDLINGGIATGTVTNDARRNKTVSVDVTGMPLEACVAAMTTRNQADAVLIAEQLCTRHYSQFIHPLAIAGKEVDTATSLFTAPMVQLSEGDAIGGCGGYQQDTNVANMDVGACDTHNVTNAWSAMAAIDRGQGRFFAGATGCSICHVNAEFSLASVSAATGFGAPALPPLPAGQLRRIVAPLPMERMPWDAAPTIVYDIGYYNIGLRPTAEDYAQGDQINGVPLSFSRLGQLLAGGAPLDGANEPNLNAGFAELGQQELAAIEQELTVPGAPGDMSQGLWIPTAPDDLTPRQFPFTVSCAPNAEFAGGGRRNQRQTTNNCDPTVMADERIGVFGAFKTPNLRNVKFTGPYFHNGSAMSLRQVFEFYKQGGNFPNINFNNIADRLGPFALNPEDEASTIEFMETGLTDWNLAYQQGKFDHPQLCVPYGHNGDETDVLKSVPAVGAGGSQLILQTFEEQLSGVTEGRINTMQDACDMPQFTAADSWL